MLKFTRGELCNGLKVVDLGTGMPGALVAKLFVDAGAAVTRVSTGEDPFTAHYPAYEIWQRGKTMLRVDDISVAALDDILATADLCILGGESHPDAPTLPDGKTLSDRHGRLVVLEITAEPDDRDRPAAELLAQARSGFAYEYTSVRPIQFAFPLASYGAALQGTIAALAALCEREVSGRGQLVGTSLLEGGMMWCAPLWFEAEHPDRAILADIPRDVQPLVFRCADDRFIHFMMGTPGALKKLHGILGIDDPTVDPNDRGMPTGKGERRHFWGNVDLFQERMIKFQSADLLKALWAEGMAAELVEPPGTRWSDPQVEHNQILVHAEDGTRHVGFPIVKGETLDPPIPGSTPDRVAETVRGEQAGGPLAGLKVLDMGSFVAGPYLSVVLGDLGADVIKFETLAGDVNRLLLRAFACTNRGKRSLSVDLKAAEGVEILRRACLWADIVHHNSRPGVSQKLGVDAETLRRLKPGIVVEETSGYGHDGPSAHRPGFDMLFQAMCGHEFRGSGEGHVPLWNRSAIVDFGAGMLGAIGALFALLTHRRGGSPPPTFVNLLDTGLFLMSELIETPEGILTGAPRMNAAMTGSHPAERLYEAADGWLAIVVRGDAMARRLARITGLEDELTAAVRDWTEVEGNALAGWVAARPRAAVTALLEEAKVWHEICDADRSGAAMADPKLQESGIVLRTNEPKYGEFRQIGPAFRFSRTKPVLSERGRMPGLGQHTHEILAELGYGDAEIEALKERKVIA